MVFKLPRLFDGSGGPGSGSKKKTGRKNNSAVSNSSSVSITPSNNSGSMPSSLSGGIWGGGNTNISNPISGGPTYTVNQNQTPSPDKETATLGN